MSNSSDSRRVWTIVGLIALGILVGIGPFQRGHSLLKSCNNDDDVEYVINNDAEGSTGGDVSFRGKSIQHSCNIDDHNCSFGIDSNNDGYCDNCENNEFKCSMAKHSN